MIDSSRPYYDQWNFDKHLPFRQLFDTSVEVKDRNFKLAEMGRAEGLALSLKTDLKVRSLL